MNTRPDKAMAMFIEKRSYCIGSDITTPTKQDGFIHIKTHLTSDSYESNTDFIKRIDPVYSALLSKAAVFLASVLQPYRRYLAFLLN